MVLQTVLPVFVTAQANLHRCFVQDALQLSPRLDNGSLRWTLNCLQMHAQCF